jgi:hypothetical protein
MEGVVREMLSRSTAIFLALGALAFAGTSSVAAAPTTMPSGVTAEVGLPSFDVDLQPPATLRPVTVATPAELPPDATAPLPSAAQSGMVALVFAGWMIWRIRRRGGWI